MVHSNNTKICSLPCKKFPQISLYNGCTRCHIREVHIIFNSTNHHFGFDVWKKGTWRYARLVPKVAGHGICSTHFLVGRQSVSFQIPAREKIQLNWFKHHLFWWIIRYLVKNVSVISQASQMSAVALHSSRPTSVMIVTPYTTENGWHRIIIVGIRLSGWK